ncbi:hypothetical protein GCM10027075_52140 [Streptomyces heilongjiangensis]
MGEFLTETGIRTVGNTARFRQCGHHGCAPKINVGSLGAVPMLCIVLACCTETKAVFPLQLAGSEMPVLTKGVGRWQRHRVPRFDAGGGGETRYGGSVTSSKPGSSSLDG